MTMVVVTHEWASPARSAIRSSSWTRASSSSGPPRRGPRRIRNTNDAGISVQSAVAAGYRKAQARGCPPAWAFTVALCGSLKSRVGRNDSVGEVSGSLLRHVVPDAGKHAVRVRAGEHRTVLGSVGRCTVEVAGDRDGGHRDDRRLREFRLQFVVLGLTVGEAQPPPIVVDHDADVIGIVERCRRPVVGRVVEYPLRGRLFQISLLKSWVFCRYPRTPRSVAK